MVIGYRYHVEDTATGRTVYVVAHDTRSARRKAWRMLGYEHMPFTNYTQSVLLVRFDGAVIGRVGN